MLPPHLPKVLDVDTAVDWVKTLKEHVNKVQHFRIAFSSGLSRLYFGDQIQYDSPER